ncbi:hypothetical protein [Tolypothrix sp. VBCCA 56010]|uniref:hypothetical protein n=1 Tax=Tolypothrix sp. VBCCA 56010 TaxID=3137731 RepID=UPI003D7D2EE7
MGNGQLFNGQWKLRITNKSNLFFMPHAHCPMPIAPCPFPLPQNYANPSPSSQSSY